MPRVRFTNDELESEVDEGAALALAAELAEATLPFGCRSGTCGTCALTVLEGLEALDPPGLVELDTLDVTRQAGPGRRLGCQILLRGCDVTVSW